MSESDSKSTGVDFVLYLEPDRLFAVRIVRLFNTAVALWCADHEKHTYSIPLRLIHEHFREFAHRIRLDDPVFNYDHVRNSCEAVLLYDRAYSDPRGKTVAWMYTKYQFDIPLLEDVCRSLAERAPVRVDLNTLRIATQATIDAIDQAVLKEKLHSTDHLL